MVYGATVVIHCMIPIHELFNRIGWDPEFARGSFQLGNYERAQSRVVVVPLKEVIFPPDSPQTSQLVDAEGRTRRVPFHSVREVPTIVRRLRHPRRARAGGYRFWFSSGVGTLRATTCPIP